MSRDGIHKFPGGGESSEGCAGSASLPIDSIGQKPMPWPSRSVKLESRNAKNKGRGRKDREQPSLDGEKTRRRILEWMCSCHHAHFAVGPQFFDKFVEQTGID